MAFDFDLLVIGAGSGGVRCARIAASHGAKVGIVEGRHWGGTCVNVGCVPKKIMLYASEYSGMIEDSRAFGWDVSPPNHQWSVLTSARNTEVERLNGIYVSMLQKAGVALFTGMAGFVDEHTVYIAPSELDPNGKEQRITAERVVIATGSKPHFPSTIPGIEHAISSDDIFHLAEMPQKICVIGSGYIGVEFSGIFAGLGAEVHHVYRQDLPLRGFDRDLRIALHEAILERGIHRHSGVHPLRIVPKGNQRLVELDEGITLEVDSVLFATGRQPNIQSLALDKAGIKVDENGSIVTNSLQETSQPHIYAIGDVTNQLNLTPVAIAEGHMLADRLFGKPHYDWSFPTTPKAVFFSPPIASVGLSEEEAAALGDVDIYVSRFTPMRRTITKRSGKVVMKIVVDTPSQKVLGVHMMGEDAPEILQGIAIAVTAGLYKHDFDRTIGIHPSMAEELVTMRTLTRQVKKTG
ncbi:glutathione-disulfide reductase [Entomobacter blattae]|uniref:Glutathione amide reductase n=1 Tax=Entomobacter blattae TaxID=2762277 RepID=A0A7H1NUL9_9PROT|nr:glutathione-disulfide reductase [Entomobacter blattae]QNT79479.1 Glutathione amide reductase [Entomobacter blattae]